MHVRFFLSPQKKNLESSLIIKHKTARNIRFRKVNMYQYMCSKSKVVICLYSVMVDTFERGEIHELKYLCFLSLKILPLQNYSQVKNKYSSSEIGWFLICFASQSYLLIPWMIPSQFLVGKSRWSQCCIFTRKYQSYTASAT